MFSCVILFYFSNYNHFLSLFLFLIFVVGFISDINLLSSPKLRFLIQTIIVIFFIVLLDVKVHQTKIYLLDLRFYKIFTLNFFSIFCFLVLINGSNFIDGLNGSDVRIFYYNNFYNFFSKYL